MKTTQIYPGLIVTPVSQRLDEVAARRLYGTTRRHLQRGAIMQAFDLRPLSNIDSATLAALIRSLRAVRQVGGTIGLIVNQPNILKVLSITGLDRIFPVYSTEDELFAAVSHREIISA